MHTMPCVPRGIGFAADLRVDNLGSGYTFAVASPGRAGATSSPFAVYVAFATVAAGGGHTCSVTTRNAVYTTTSGGRAHTCGVTTSGDAYCWGANPDGRLGDGTTVQRATPVPVGGGLTFAMISAGSAHTCGMTSDRSAYCWGANGTGQLGNGTTTGSLTPVPVAGQRADGTMASNLTRARVGQ